jgi:hypothetical protein
MGYARKNKKIRSPSPLASRVVAGAPKNPFLLGPEERRSSFAEFLIADHLSVYFGFMQGDAESL